jgi:hypothetical protein
MVVVVYAPQSRGAAPSNVRCTVPAVCMFATCCSICTTLLRSHGNERMKPTGPCGWTGLAGMMLWTAFTENFYYSSTLRITEGVKEFPFIFFWRTSAATAGYQNSLFSIAFIRFDTVAWKATKSLAIIGLQ